MMEEGMRKLREEFNETTDLYQEMLREAQRLEDKKLIEMIKQRLEYIAPPPLATTRECEIIMFPRRFNPPFQHVEDSRFWPKVEFIQLGVIFSGYLLFIMGCSFIS